jgi:chromosome segregation ATPase
MMPRFQDVQNLEYAPRAMSFAGGSNTSPRRVDFQPRDEAPEGMSALDVVGNDYLDVSDTIQKATRTIEELVKRNQALRADADAAVSHLRKELSAEREHSGKLEKDVGSLQLKHSNASEAYERRLFGLESEKRDLADRLQKVEESLDLANQWLEFLSSNVRMQLSDAVKKSDQLFKDRLPVVQ